jgi:starch synthase
MKPNSIKVLFLASEADPLVKVGGLGDVAGSLPAALQNLPAESLMGRQIEVKLVLPFHSAIRKKIPSPVHVVDFEIPSKHGPVPAQTFYHEVKGVGVYLISGLPIPEDGPVYNPVAAIDGPKFVFFSLASLELARKLDWAPDILHANDWHTALSVYALKNQQLTDPFFKYTHSVLTVHNLPFIGLGTEDALDEFNQPASHYPMLPSWARRLPLPLGLQAAEKIVAVSQTYAREILKPEYGYGLEHFLTKRKKIITGILNGLDQECWNPATDKAIAANYSKNSPDSRLENRNALIKEFDLNPDPALPLLILISRMDRQKGVDLAIEGLQAVKDLPWQAILLGSGDPALELVTQNLAEDLPKRVRAIIRFDAALSRRMYAGADILLMPSRYEPCGLAQMIAMRYGCVPLARATGGLVDTIVDADEDPQKGTGFLFKQASAEACASTLGRALKAYSDPQKWSRLQQNGMAQDFSWQRSALDYAKIYQQLMRG